jgi:predicted peptidase
MRFIVIIPLLALMVDPSAAQSSRLTAADFSQKVRYSSAGEYLFYLPDGYAESDASWPLLLFLHGAGERGDDVRRVAIHGPLKHVREGRSFPFIIVAPLVPANERWTTVRLDAVMNEVRERFRIDPSRLYLTGLSMGGYGTWDYAMNRPDLFAAVAPICGGGQAHFACVLKDTPVWAFHGARDEVVPVERTREIVRVLEACDGDIRYTEYPDAGHDSWTATYADADFYRWLLDQKRR